MQPKHDMINSVFFFVRTSRLRLTKVKNALRTFLRPRVDNVFRTQSLSNCGYSVDFSFRLELYRKSSVFKTPGHATDLLPFKSDRQFGRLVRTCAIRLTAVLHNHASRSALVLRFRPQCLRGFLLSMAVMRKRALESRLCLPFVRLTKSFEHARTLTSFSGQSAFCLVGLVRTKVLQPV